MARLETRKFGSAKHLLVIANKREAKLLFSALGKNLPVKVHGDAVLSDDCTTVYIRLSKTNEPVRGKSGEEIMREVMRANRR